MIAHLSLSVHSLRQSDKFYRATFGALGIERMYLHEDTRIAGYGRDSEEVMTLYESKDGKGLAAWPYGTHVAFTAKTQQEVLNWHAAALKNGGRDDGGPGLRDYYGPGYYSAFAIDPNGYRVEAVYHFPVDDEGRVKFM